MASQYAGWADHPDGYFAMGSGPLRAKARVEHELFASSATRKTRRAACSCSRGARCRPTRSRRGSRERPASRRRADLRGRADREPRRRRADRRARDRDRPAQDGRRSGSTSGASSARWAPRRCRRSAKNDMRAIGRTNDCVLYGGQARYTVRADDDELAELAAKAAGIGVARLRHAVLRHLQALRQRLLQDRPAAVQPGGGLAHQRDQRTDVSRRPRSMPTCCARRSSRRADACVHVAILSARTGWHTDELLPRAGRARPHVASCVPYEALVARLGRGRPRRASRSTPSELARRRTPCWRASSRTARSSRSSTASTRCTGSRIAACRSMNSPRAIERCVDKFYTSRAAARGRAATPETVVCERIDDAMAAVREMGDVIVKPLFGSMGHGIVRVSDPETRVPRLPRARADARRVLRAARHRARRPRRPRVRRRRSRRRRDRASRTRRRLAHQRLARRRRHARSICPPRWCRSWRSPPRAPSARTTPASTCCQHATGRVYVLEVNGIPGWQALQKATGDRRRRCAIVDHLELRRSCT